MINTDKLELYMKPVGYSAGKLNTLLPKSGYFTVYRNSGKNRIGSDGYMRWVEAHVPAVDYEYGKGIPKLNIETEATNLLLYPFAVEHSSYAKKGLTVELDPSTAGSELVTNGDFINWTNDNPDDWILYGTEDDNNYITEDSGGARFVSDGNNLIYIYQSILSTDKPYLVSIDIGNITSGNIRINAGDVGVFPEARTGIQSFYVYPKVSKISILPNGVCDVTVNSISVKEVSGFASPFKDASGNVLLKARKLVEDTSDGQHKLQLPTTTISQNTNSIKFIAKQNGRSKVNLYMATYVDGAYTTDNVNYDFNTDTFSSPTSSAITYQSNKLADGYVELDISTSYSGTVTKGYGVVRLLDFSNNVSYIGDGTSGIYVSGLYFKEGLPDSFPNDPEAAEGSQVTRLADNIKIPAYTDESVVTWIFDIEVPDYLGTMNIPLFEKDIYLSNGYRAYFYINNNVALQSFQSGTANTIYSASNSINIGRNKIAIAINNNTGEGKFAYNGTVEAFTFTPYVIGNNLFRLSYGGGIGRGTDGKVYKVIKTESVLSDERLIELTK
jgi:hypothetical protein